MSRVAIPCWMSSSTTQDIPLCEGAHLTAWSKSHKTSCGSALWALSLLQVQPPLLGKALLELHGKMQTQESLPCWYQAQWLPIWGSIWDTRAVHIFRYLASLQHFVRTHRGFSGSVILFLCISQELVIILDSLCCNCTEAAVGTDQISQRINLQKVKRCPQSAFSYDSSMGCSKESGLQRYQPHLRLQAP